MSAAVLLTNPKTPYNVGSALRACSIFGAEELAWTGDRVLDPRIIQRTSRVPGEAKHRFPREERMRDYQHVYWHAVEAEGCIDEFVDRGFTPVCVEVSDRAERLPDFVHPKDALYVLGPEDGHVPKALREVCHRFVVIPTMTTIARDTQCLNLAATVNVVLYDRMVKLGSPLARGNALTSCAS